MRWCRAHKGMADKSEDFWLRPCGRGVGRLDRACCAAYGAGKRPDPPQVCYIADRFTLNSSATSAAPSLGWRRERPRHYRVPP